MGKKQPPPAPAIRVDKISLKNIKTDFIDRKIKPNFSTSLVLSEGRITGLASENFQAADVLIKGNLNNTAPVKISGRINPLAKHLFADLALKLDNMEMAPFSPYTGKYVDRAIEKGKLNLDLVYKIKQKELHADHHIVMDQFSLGNTVDSPDPMGLPVGLAVTLLKDRKGVIDVKLPVSGRIDDPAFKVTRIVFKALGNLFKAAEGGFATSRVELGVK